MPPISKEILTRFGLRQPKETSSGSTPRLNLPPSLALLAPTFPTLSALATVKEESQPTPASSSGLFQALLRDPTVLLQSLLDDPTRYEEGVGVVVQDLVSGRRKFEELSPAESTLLDRATIDFAQPVRRKTAAAPVPQKRAAPRTPKPTPRAKAPSVAGMEPYWWL